MVTAPGELTDRERAILGLLVEGHTVKIAIAKKNRDRISVGDGAPRGGPLRAFDDRRSCSMECVAAPGQRYVIWPITAAS